MWKYALDTTLVRVDSISVHVHVGEVWHPDDPVVRAYPSLFGDDPPVVKRYPGWSPPVEQATAAPGERRRSTRGN